MNKLILTLLIVVIFNLSLTASEFDNNYNQFDDLLFSGDFDKLQTELSSFQNRYSENFSDEDSLRIEKYERVLGFEALIDPNDPEMLENFITGKKAEEISFSETFAGNRSYQSYQKFLDYTGQQNYVVACKYYFIADYFRNQNIETQLSQIKIIYKKAQALYDEESYPAVISLIDENSFDPGNNQYLKIQHDSLMTLRSDAESRIKRMNDQMMLWGNKEKFNKKLFVSLGIRAISRPQFNSTDFESTNQGTTYTIGIPDVPGNTTIGICGEILYKVAGNLFIGTELNYTKFKFKSEDDQSLIFFDFDYSAFTSHLKSTYYLKSTTGFRPYFSAGIGYFSASRDGAEVTRMVNVNNVNVPITYEISSETYSSIQSLFEFGFQIIYSQESNVFVNFSSSFFNNFDEQDGFISKYNSLIAVRIGLIL